MSDNWFADERKICSLDNKCDKDEICFFWSNERTEIRSNTFFGWVEQMLHGGYSATWLVTVVWGTTTIHDLYANVNWKHQKQITEYLRVSNALEDVSFIFRTQHIQNVNDEQQYLIRVSFAWDFAEFSISNTYIKHNVSVRS